MKHKFKLTRLWVASLLLLFGFTTNAWANFPANKVFYFDASGNTNWTQANFNVKFNWYWNSGDFNEATWCKNKVSGTTWIYYTTSPNTDYNNGVQLCRMDPSDDSKQWNCTSQAIGDNRGNNNCLYCKSDNYNWWDSWTPGWKTYVPPMKSLSIANNGTTTASGTGTESDPYIIAAGATIKVKATAALQVDDSNPTFKYKYSVDGDVVQDYGSGNNTYQFTAGTEAHTYAVTVRAYATYNSTDNTAIDGGNTIYFKVPSYIITYDPETAPTGCTYTTTPTTGVYGSSISMTIAPADGYTIAVSAKNSSTSASISLSKSDNTYSFTMPASNVAVTVTPTETLHTVSVVCKDEHNTQIGTGDNVTGVGIATSKDVTAPTIAGYTFNTWVLTEGVTSSSTLTNKTISINATADGKTITAKYTKDASFSLQVAKGTHVTTVSGDQATIELGHSYAISATGFDNGYEFKNWTASPEENAVFESSTSASTNVTVNNGSVIVTANAKATTYTIEYVLPEGVTTTNPTSYTIESAEITLTNPTNRTGYDFAGWTCEGNPITKIAQGSTGNKTITATWTAQTYTITYKDQNNATFTGSWPTPDAHPTTHTYDTETQLVSPTRVGYTFAGWFGNKECIGEAMTSIPATAYTANFTLYAKWTPKTYTISFDDNGGTGGQTATVTATYDQPMPGHVTCPTRVGYKFNGYWSQQSGGTQYYTANGTATANTWTNDAVGGTATIYAQWQQLYCFIEGRFHIATDKTRTSWTNTFDGKHSDWYTESTTIPFTWNETKKRYELATNATLKDLSGKISGYNPDFFIKQSTSSSSLQNVKSYNHDGTLSSEEGMKNAMDAEADKNCKFSSNDMTGYVTICFDESDIWFELEKVTTYSVTIQSFNGGSVDPSGTHKIGSISLAISADASDGYHFNRWTTTGGVNVGNETSASTTITATGDGTITANFASNTDLYFQAPNDWNEDGEVWVYFNPWWDETKGVGTNDYRPDGKKMEPLGNRTYRLTYSSNDAGVTSGKIAFINGQKNNADPVKDAKGSYRGDFNHCSPYNWFIAENYRTHEYKDHKTEYYNRGDWATYYDRVEYYFENSATKPAWQPIEECRFKNTDDHNIKRLVLENVAANQEIEFKVWSTCNCWFGVGETGCVIQEDTKNYGVGTGDKNVTLKTWKDGSYEIIYHINSNELDVTYLGDITVANFPGEVSTFVNRQHKIKPDVTLRNGTTVNDVTITVTHAEGDNDIATYEQNGTNLVITGKNNGSETVTVRYQNNKVPEPYVVERTLKVNVADPIIIQAKLTAGDTHWTKTGLVHIHFWGDHAETAQDLTMSYNSETKLFSVTAPMISNPFNFMFWYGEDINQSASEAWRKTVNLSTDESACYTIDNTTSNETPRNADKESVLCSTDEYYVEITMKNGNTYKSNTIDNLDKEVSFFAPMDNDDTYMGGTIRIVHNGEVSDPITGFAAAGVYVAQIANASGFVANSIKPYTGNYYIRTDGAHGAWGDYKTDADNLMTSFTARAEKGETYSYYWVKNVAKNGDNNDGKTNVKADIANDYNDNLAGMIENDKFTDGGGFVYNSTNGANVRFSYEPTTNEFKRAILGGSSDNNFLNVYSKTNNLYADNAHSKQLNENADLSDSKFSDLSDWVYEKQVYVVADGVNASKVILKSVFNGQTTHLLGYTKNAKGEDTDTPNELEIMGSQSNGDYALRITYDFKKNRLIASWEPGALTIDKDQVIDSDVLFVQQEAPDGTIDDTDVAQITYADDAHDAKLTSLKNMIYVLEVTDKVIDKTSPDNQLYWICLPFDCRISDIYGVEGYVTLNAAGQATDGLWGIQRYDGTTRAQHGWFIEDNPEGFWRWMKRDETMKAGTGYVVVFDKTNAGSWPSIDVEEVCEGETDGCKGGKKTVQKRLKRLYFPSIGSKFEISYAGDGANVVHYEDEPCNVTSPADRRADDSNWKVIGPVSYNNIGVDNTKQDNLTFYYTYDQSAAQGSRYSERHAITGLEEFKSFHSYMTQFGGTLTWKPFTKSEDVTLKAPLYTENSEFQGGLLTIELNDAQGKELNHTFINLSKNGTTGFDQNLDLTKITENCAQIASVSEDVLYAGNTLPLDIEMVPLNVKVVANGTYDIALAQSLEGLEVRLYDAFEQTTTPLDLMSATVTLDKGEYKDRFFLQFVQKSPLTPTNFNGTIDQFNLPSDKTQKLLINDNIYLINAGRIYNVLGARP